MATRKTKPDDSTPAKTPDELRQAHVAAGVTEVHMAAPRELMSRRARRALEAGGDGGSRAGDAGSAGAGASGTTGAVDASATGTTPAGV